MRIAISTALIMGFSNSLSCMVWCVPVIMPYVATSKKPSLASGFFSVTLFSLGRLISYVGLMTVLLVVRELVTVSPALTLAATLTSGVILIASGLSSMGIIRWSSRLGGLFCQHMTGDKSPLYLGMLTGLRPCGPLLAAITLALALPTIGEISAFILFFWLASSVVVLTLGAAGGQLARVAGGRLGIERLRQIVGIAMVVIGIFLLLQVASLASLS